jgi:hypothetical protein
MAENKLTYTCPHHKVEHTGQKRETFQKEFYDALMWVDMMTSMRLYKDVKVSCHCPENYDAFDTILKEVTKPSAPEATLAELASPMAPKDPELTIK